MKISKNKKMCFFLMSQGSLDPKIWFLGQKMCSVAHVQTDTKVNTEDTLSRGSGFFPSTYHQGSVQYLLFILIEVRIEPNTLESFSWWLSAGIFGRFCGTFFNFFFIR